jgi:hypothetical protein
MVPRSAIAALTMVLCGMAGAAHGGPCDRPPPDVVKFLRMQHEAALLTAGDLGVEDRKLWLSGPNANRCPGLTAAKLDGPSSGSSYILVLKPSGPRKPARIILLRRLGAALMPESIPVNPGPLPVVWSLGPGVATSWDNRTRVRIPNDSFIVEYIEASATQYYVRKRRLRQITISD